MTHLSLRVHEVVIFMLFLGIGFWIGSDIQAEPGSAIRAERAQTQETIPALPDGERMLLLVGVDSLDTMQPNIQGMWLLTYYLKDHPIQLMPIYPSGSEQDAELDDQILRTFSLEEEHGETSLNPEFMRMLADHNYWFSGYMLIDQEAQAQMIDGLGGLPGTQGTLGGEQILAALPSSLLKPAEAVNHQAMLLGQVCLALSRRTDQAGLSSTLALIPEHIQTNLDPSTLSAEFEAILSNPAVISCEFPTLTALP